MPLVMGLSVATFLVPDHVAGLIGVPTMIVGHTLAGIMMIRGSRGDSPTARPWRLMGFALLTAVSGLVAVAVIGENAPVFGPADSLFLGAYVLIIVALAKLARSDPHGPPWGLTMLDAFVGAVAATAIVWEVVLGQIEGVQASTLERAGLSLYPILDVGIIVALSMVVLRRSNYRFDPRVAFLAVGMVFQVVADILYLREGVLATNFQDAQPRFGLFVAASACYLGAAAFIDRTPARREFPDRETPLWALIWPYLLATALIPLHVLRLNGLLDDLGSNGVALNETTQIRVVLFALLLVGVLIVIRQAVAIKHNRSRVELQRRELISSVSHELRTPLTAVVGFIHVLEENPGSFSPAEQESMMGEISSQAKHMSRTVTDLITLARDGGENLMIRSVEANLADIVESAADEAHGAVFTSDVDDHVLHVDAGRLAQAIGHLLANARNYGGGRVHLLAGVQGGTLTVEVHDDGPGVPTKYLSSVWKQFDRGERRLDSTSPGLGIGLAIVRAVAAAHGGTADYRRSELLRGSCFSITMPANIRSGAPWIRELTAR
jgi:signal transduction histidine kinase